MMKLRTATDGLLMFYCPGCGNYHGIWTDRTGPNPLNGAKWTWNGSMDSPTFSPSVHVQKPKVCHSFVRDGRIEFLNDCEHPLAGQTVAMIDED